MLEVWLKVLDVLDRLMGSGQSASSGGGPVGMGMLEEQVPESLKNILLVMADGGYLVPPGSLSSPEREGMEGGGAGGGGSREGGGNEDMIWEETRRRVERFLPGLFGQVFPGAGEAVTATETSPTEAGGG